MILDGLVKCRKSREEDSIVGRKERHKWKAQRQKVYRTDSVVEVTDKVAELRKPGVHQGELGLPDSGLRMLFCSKCGPIRGFSLHGGMKIF